MSARVVTHGPAFAVPAIDAERVYAASGFSGDCKGMGRVYAFDKASLEVIWATEIEGAIGDTSLINANGVLIFGVGDGVAGISAKDGARLWHTHIGGCFQESFLKFDEDRVYIGNNLGQVVALTTNGKMLWSAQVSESVFGAPASFGQAVIVADMSNTITALDSKTGEKLWEHTLPVRKEGERGIFAGPYVNDESIYVGTYGGEFWRLDVSGHIKARHQGEQRFIAKPVICGGNIVTADIGTRVYWLDPLSLEEKTSLDVEGRFLFGSVQCYEGQVVVTTYGRKGKPSTLYLLRDGEVVRAIDFPCCLHALPGTQIEQGSATNILTSFSSFRRHNMQVVRTNLKDIQPPSCRQ